MVRDSQGAAGAAVTNASRGLPWLLGLVAAGLLTGLLFEGDDLAHRMAPGLSPAIPRKNGKSQRTGRQISQ